MLRSPLQIHQQGHHPEDRKCVQNPVCFRSRATGSCTATGVRSRLAWLGNPQDANADNANVAAPGPPGTGPHGCRQCAHVRHASKTTRGHRALTRLDLAELVLRPTLLRARTTNRYRPAGRGMFRYLALAGWTLEVVRRPRVPLALIWMAVTT